MQFGGQNFKDYYKTLGVEKTADQTEIKKAFRALARKYHPDHAGGDAAFEAKFKEINEAYEVLGDPEKRRKYDQLGSGWNQQGGGYQRQYRSRQGQGGFASSGDFSDFFETFFGGGGSPFGQGGGGYDFGGGQQFRSSPRPRKGGDLEADLAISLEEANDGATREIKVRDAETGKLTTYRIKVPAGVQQDQVIRMSGKGSPGQAGGEAGDLLLRVRFLHHPDFTVEGNDLYYEAPLMPWDAILGTTVTVPTLKDKVSIKVPAGSKHGRKMRLKGLGMLSKSGERGYLYVVVDIRLPEETTEEQKVLWTQLKESYEGHGGRK